MKTSPLQVTQLFPHTFVQDTIYFQSYRTSRQEARFSTLPAGYRRATPASIPNTAGTLGPHREEISSGISTQLSGVSRWSLRDDLISTLHLGKIYSTS